MNKIKVIDLLNMISKGEEVPKKIEYRNIKFLYDKNNKCYIVENYNEYNDLLMELSNHKGTDLNYEVEIIEEEKKIPEKLGKIDDNDGYIDQNDVIKIAKKVDEIIDYLKSKGE